MNNQMDGMENKDTDALLQECLRKVLETLTPREECVLGHRLGLGGVSKTSEEVARRFEVSRDVILQVEKDALRKLRHPARIQKLGAFLPQFEALLKKAGLSGNG